MKRNTLHCTLVALMFGCVPLSGCDDGSDGRGPSGSGPTGGKADDTNQDGDLGEVQRAHLEAVGICETQAGRDRDHTSELRVDNHVEIETLRGDCLIEANGLVVDDLERTLTDSESSLAGAANAAFETWRSAQSNLCELLTDGSDDASTKAAAVVTARCGAEAELHLAELVQAFADLGGPTAAAPTGSEAYPACYEAFETASAGEGADVNAAAGQLASCIRSEILDEAGVDLAIRISEAFPGRDEDTLLTDVENRFARQRSGAKDACMLLGAAGPAAGTQGAELQFHGCEVTAAIWMGRLIGAAIPALAPGGPEAPQGGDPPPPDGGG